MLEGQTYELVQFHFHATSEHTQAGEHAPMELHLVHSTAAGELAVVGAWLEVGEHNAAFEPVFNNLPATETEPEAVPGETVNADDLLPAERTYHRYNGSLTTPPCTQGVKWVMLSETVELSAEQIAAYTNIYDNNFRPVQEFNDRTFLNTGETDSAADAEPAAAESEPAAEAEPAAEEAEPATLPQSGGVAFPFAGFFVGLGAVTLLAGAGLYLYSRR